MRFQNTLNTPYIFARATVRTDARAELTLYGVPITWQAGRVKAHLCAWQARRTEVHPRFCLMGRTPYPMIAAALRRRLRGSAAKKVSELQ